MKMKVFLLRCFNHFHTKSYSFRLSKIVVVELREILKLFPRKFEKTEKKNFLPTITKYFEKKEERVKKSEVNILI